MSYTGEGPFYWEDLASAPSSYTITFNSNGGSSISSIYDATELPTPLPIPTKSGYTFGGWYYDSDFTYEAFADDPLTGDVTLYAKWGLTSGPKVFAVGDVLPATTQLRISWTFAGSTYHYFPYVFPGVVIKNNNNNQIIYYVYDYSGGGTPGDTYITINGIAVYSWLSWNAPYTDTNGNHAYIDIDTSNWTINQRTIAEVDHDIKDYFYWEDLNALPQGFNITFEENGGTSVTDLTEQTALPNPLPTPTKDNHTFLGWYYDSDFTNEAFADDPLTGDVTLYAKWELNTYTITYNSNGGSSIPQTSDATQLPNPLPTPTKDNHTFLGWYYDSDFTNEAFAGDPLTSDVTLYAKWELNTYTITFNSNGGTTIPDIEEATELPDPLPIPTKSGYTFVNWYYDSAFTQKANAGDTLESNVTLYAKWELNTYTITYNSNGGSSIPQTSNVTQLPSELPIPTKARNTFVGWYYDSTLKQKAKPNDTINTNVTLYAKWYDSLSAFYTDIANLIREFENSSDNIKVIDFADRLRALLESV
jgi:uncharacterized repeat protein (TIGR02543 family)